MGASAKAWNPNLHAGGGNGWDPGNLLQAGGAANGSKTGSKTGPTFREHSLAESLKTITDVTTQPSEVRPRELFDQLYKHV